MEKKKCHKYFQLGDIVRNPDVWGKTLFVIHGFGGNEYLPEIYVHQYGKERSISTTANWDVRMTKLVTAKKRPLVKVNKRLLVRMISKGIVEARREFIMRNNNK